jgi:hypothetical protein
VDLSEAQRLKANLDWITCLRAPAMQALAAENGALQLSMFDDRDLAEMKSARRRCSVSIR